MESLNVFKRESLKSEEECKDEVTPMDINETPYDDYFEEGEINSSDDDNTAEKSQTNISNVFTRNIYKEQNQGFVTGLNIFGKDETLKKLDRAKRFALPLKNDSLEVHQEKLSSLYRDLGIDKENERHFRLNVIHMRGTENMSTKDVLDYFISYAPSHIEWVNDVSCNVVWADDVSAARALLNMSKRIKNLDKVHVNADPFEKDFKEQMLDDEETVDDNSVDARTIKVAIPPGFWRIGNPSNKSSIILFRYATRSDKKQQNAEKNSEYYRKYGNPHYGNIPGILSKSLREEFKKFKFKNPNSGNIWKNSSKEDEKHLNGRKNPWEELAHEWGKTDKVEDEDYIFTKSRISKRPYSDLADLKNDIPDLRISLINKKENKKRMREREEETSLIASDSEEWESKSKYPRMKMYADDEEKKLEKNLGMKFKSNSIKDKPVEDLRSKINRKKNRPRFKFRAEKTKLNEDSNNESSYSENEYDEGDYSDWALEQYHDLRESLEQNKRQDQKLSASKYQKESDESDDSADTTGSDDNNYEIHCGQRSPLQIEIDNDEYYEKNKIRSNS